MFDRTKISTFAGVTAALLVAGCGSPDRAEPMAETAAFTDQWANAADTGMAAVFGTVTNTGRQEVRLVGGESPVAGRVEVHEVVADGGGKAMRPKADGLAVPAGGTHELTPGGDHLMLMDLREPMRPGADVSITVRFEDGSTLPVTVQVRDFPGADEDYQPGHHHG